MTPACATLASGVRLHYRVQGRPGAPWLVLINGLLADTTMWAGALKGLTGRHRVLTFDSRGQGRSDAPAEGPYPVSLLAQEAWELVEMLGIRRPWLAGLSNGSSIGLELLAGPPGRVPGRRADQRGARHRLPHGPAPAPLAAMPGVGRARAAVRRRRPGTCGGTAS